MIKNLYKAVLFGVTVVASVTITSCSSEDEPMMPASAVQNELASRSAERDVAHIITFEEGSRTLAGPTSYGENLYATYTPASGRYIRYNYSYSTGEIFSCGLNNLNGAYNFYNGGIALSQWNIRSNPSGQSGDWWYSYQNQCSVYNTASTDGTNQGAGAAGSNTFGVMYGYQDSYNTQWMSKPYFSFSSPKTLVSMYVCNTSYVYGVVKNGNSFGASGTAQSLESSKGWFKVTATGYGRDGNAVKTVEKYICDYRDSANPKIPISTTWEEWQLGLENVVRVEFNFEGSDSGSYGLNTPAYLCIDNITFK